jgi:hypothetical protein
VKKFAYLNEPAMYTEINISPPLQKFCHESPQGTLCLRSISKDPGAKCEGDLAFTVYDVSQEDGLNLT